MTNNNPESDVDNASAGTPLSSSDATHANGNPLVQWLRPGIALLSSLILGGILWAGYDYLAHQKAQTSAEKTYSHWQKLEKASAEKAYFEKEWENDHKEVLGLLNSSDLSIDHIWLAIRWAELMEKNQKLSEARQTLEALKINDSAPDSVATQNSIYQLAHLMFNRLEVEAGECKKWIETSWPAAKTGDVESILNSYRMLLKANCLWPKQVDEARGVLAQIKTWEGAPAELKKTASNLWRYSFFIESP